MSRGAPRNSEGDDGLEAVEPVELRREPRPRLSLALRHDSRVEKNPAAEMSAGDELRMEKARILSMVTDDSSSSRGCGGPFASWEQN